MYCFGCKSNNMMSEEIPHKMTTTAHSPTVSPWHSPVPYLFGGLAAMLGLIAFALLILACSYWKLSGDLDNDGENTSSDRDLELGDANSEGKQKITPVYDQKILVIMAGQALPTFLATPSMSQASSFGSNCSSTSGKSSEQPEEVKESPKPGDCDRVQTSMLETNEALDHVP